MAGYIRQSLAQIQDGQIVRAAPVNAEYDTLASAFSSVSGHKHDGTPSEGAPITTIGPTQNVNATSTELYPRVDNFVSLGTSALQFKDLFVKGVSSLRNTTVTGTFNVTGATTLTGALTATTSLTAPVVRATTSLTTPTVIANVSPQGYVFTGLGSGFRSPSTGTVEVYAASGNKVAVGPTGITVTGDLAAQNTLSVTGTSSLTGNTSLGGSLTVTRASALNGGATTTTLNTTGNVSVGGTLNVVSNTTLSSVAASSLAVTGATTLTGAAALNGGLTTTTATTTGNVSVGGTLNVVGNTTLAAVTGTSITASGNLSVTGTATLNGEVTATNGIESGSGSAAGPAFSFTTDPDTGVYRPAADQVGVSTGGVNRLTVKTNTVETSVPVRVPNGTISSPSLSFTSGTDAGISYDSTLQQMHLSSAGTSRIVLGSSGTSLGGSVSLLADSTLSGYNAGSFPSATRAYGTANALTVDIPAGLPASIFVWPTASNTGAATISINGGPARALQTPTGTALPAGFLYASTRMPFHFVCDPSNGGVGPWTVIRPDERGNDANGAYVRLANGWQLCDIILATASTGETTWTYPSLFVAIPRVVVSASRVVGFATASSNTLSSVEVSTYGVSGSRINGFATATAVGRWY